MTKTEESLKSNERLVPESELKKAQARIKELERVLGRKTMDVEHVAFSLDCCDRQAISMVATSVT